MSAPALLDSLRDAISLAQAAELLPTKPHLSQLHRWCEAGFDLNHGRRDVPPNVIYLESWWIGRRRVTTRDALERFVAAMNRATAPAPKARPTEKLSRRQRAKRNTVAARAGKQVDALLRN
jgi:hypothetical protein